MNFTVISQACRHYGRQPEVRLRLFTVGVLVRLTWPPFTVQQRIREVGLWTVYRPFDCHRPQCSYTRRYRGRRAGRSRRPVPTLRPVGYGAFLVTCLPTRGFMNKKPCTSTNESKLIPPVVRQSALISVNVAPLTTHTTLFNIGVLNVQSLGNKPASINGCIVDNQLDVFAVVESWHDSFETPSVIAATPPYYRVIERTRLDRALETMK